MKKLLLVDLSAVFWRNWHATKDKEIGEAFALTVSKISSTRHGYDNAIVCCDIAPYKRKAISADYKAQRDAPDPAAVGQLRRVKERLTADGLPLAEAQGYEADDIIATICARLLGDECEWTVDILTADKDLMALVDERVSVVSLITGDRLGPPEVITKMGVEPHRVTELLALTGDTADNVPGCPGVGPKTAVQLLADNGSIGQILTCKPEELAAKGAVHAKLMEHRENIRKSLALVTLMTDAPIDLGALFTERKVEQLTQIDDAEFEEAPAAAETVTPQAQTVTPEQAAPAPKPAEPVHSAAIIKTAPVSFELALEPTGFGTAWTLAKCVHSSRLFAVESPEQAMMAIMAGREMGISSIAALRGFHFIKGRLCMSAQLMASLILKSGKAEYWELVESTNKTATYATKRVGGRNEQRKTFTVDDAKMAQLVKSDGNWQKYPAAMCEARAASALARVVYPDLLMGVYLPDEMENEP